MINTCEEESKESSPGFDSKARRNRVAPKDFNDDITLRVIEPKPRRTNLGVKNRLKKPRMSGHEILQQ